MSLPSRLSSQARLFLPPLLHSRSPSLVPSSVCLPPSSSMHYSFIILLQLPYRPHFGEDKTCHLRVESGEMMGGFKEEEEEGDGVWGGVEWVEGWRA